MNMELRRYQDGPSIQEAIERAYMVLDRDLLGIWLIVSGGRGYKLSGGDLREYLFRYIQTLISHRGVVIDAATDGVHYWARTDRYGTTPEEIAYNVTAEWIAQGEPDPPAYESIAFALPEYLDSPDNRRD